MTMYSTYFRVVGWLGALVVVAGLLTSCLTPPKYSEVPEIDFKSIQVRRITDVTGTYDTVRITLSFRDGDGDLGLNNDEVSPPFNELNSDRTRNRYYDNYFVITEQQLPGSTTWQPSVYQGVLGFTGRYPRLSTSDRAEPLRGDLNYRINLPEESFPERTQVRFRIRIADRALHESNEITTDPITIQPY